MAIIAVYPLTSNLPGVSPLYYARNGIYPSGMWANSQALAMNAILAGAKKVIFHKSIRPTEVLDTTTTTSIWRFRYHSSLNGGTVFARYVLIPVDAAVANAPTPRARWVTTIAGGAATNQAYVTDDYRVTAGATITPDHYQVIDQSFAVTANTDYQFAFSVENMFRCISCTLWEQADLFLDSSTATVVDPTPFGQSLPVSATEIGHVVQYATDSWKRSAPPLFTWCVPKDVAKTTTSTTFVNPLDASTAWSSTTAGFPIVAKNHNAIDSNNVPVTMWVYAQITAGAGTGSVEFLVNGSTIGTITGINGTAGFYTATGTLNGSNASDKVDVLYKVSAAATTLSLWSAGMYEYEA